MVEKYLQNVKKIVMHSQLTSVGFVVYGHHVFAIADAPNRLVHHCRYCFHSGYEQFLPAKCISPDYAILTAG